MCFYKIRKWSQRLETHAKSSAKLAGPRRSNPRSSICPGRPSNRQFCETRNPKLFKSTLKTLTYLPAEPSGQPNNIYGPKPDNCHANYKLILVHDCCSKCVTSLPHVWKKKQKLRLHTATNGQHIVGYRTSQIIPKPLQTCRGTSKTSKYAEKIDFLRCRKHPFLR